MAKIIREADSSDYSIYWNQLHDWQTAVRVAEKPVSDWTAKDLELIKDTFLDIRLTFGVPDQGYKSYDELASVLHNV